MRSTMVYFNDFVSSRRQCLYFDEEDYQKLDDHWDQEDQYLLTYQEIPAFKGLTRYSQLSTEHIRVLIDFVLRYHDDLTDEERQDNSHPVTTMFHYVVLALTKNIADATDGRVESLKINRAGKMNITFEASCYLDMNFSKPQGIEAEETSPFTIVVDNRDE